MKRLLLTLTLVILASAASRLFAQEPDPADTLPDNVLLKKQYSLGIMLHSNGWGLKFRRGHNVTALRQFMWEVEFASYKAAKEIRTINPYFANARSYLYGKLNYLGFLRGGIGQQHILNRKPYWGGVQLSFLYYGGLSLGITKPMYLYILHFNSGFTDYYLTTEKYNPEVHFIDNIYGRAPFLTNFFDLGFYPGLYLKTGLDFEYSMKNRSISALEVGAILDYSPRAIPVMALNPEQNFFVTIYLSFMFGKRYNRVGEN